MLTSLLWVGPVELSYDAGDRYEALRGARGKRISSGCRGKGETIVSAYGGERLGSRSAEETKLIDLSRLGGAVTREEFEVPALVIPCTTWVR